MTKSNIQSEWDSLTAITNDIKLYLQKCEALGGEELKEKVIGAIIKGMKEVKVEPYIKIIKK
jgi:hypothetical protein